MKKITIWLTLSCLMASALVLASCAPAVTEEEEVAPPEEGEGPLESKIPAHFATYTDDARFFSISYPPDWEAFSSRLEGIIPLSKDFFESYDSDVSLVGLFFVFYAESPMESGISPASVNIVVQSLSDMTIRGWLTLDEIVEAKLQRTEEIKQEYHEFSRVNAIIGGMEAVIIDWESSHPDLGKKSRCVQMFMIADKLVWKVTCYVDSEKYGYFKDDLYAIVRSLRILK